MAVAFKSATNRRQWQTFALVTTLHIGIALIVGDFLTRGGGDRWVVSGVAYATFVAISIFWWASRQFVGWFAWRLLWRRPAVNDLVAEFEKAQFPRPDGILLNANNYFDGIVNDEQQNVATRLAAAAHYLRIAEFAPQQGLITAVRIAGIYEEAIAAYQSTARVLSPPNR
jgi:hypothetical protein